LNDFLKKHSLKNFGLKQNNLLLKDTIQTNRLDKLEKRIGSCGDRRRKRKQNKTTPNNVIGSMDLLGTTVTPVQVMESEFNEDEIVANYWISVLNVINTLESRLDALESFLKASTRSNIKKRIQKSSQLNWKTLPLDEITKMMFRMHRYHRNGKKHHIDHNLKPGLKKLLELIDASSSPPKKKKQTYIRKKTVFVEKAMFSCENIPSVEEDPEEIEEEFPLPPSTRHKTRRESQESKKEKRITRNLEDALVIWRKDELPQYSTQHGKDKQSKSTKGSKGSAKASFQNKSDPVKAKSEACCWASTTCIKMALGNLQKQRISSSHYATTSFDPISLHQIPLLRVNHPLLSNAFSFPKKHFLL
jgi:hypothetical protein